MSLFTRVLVLALVLAGVVLLIAQMQTRDRTGDGSDATPTLEYVVVATLEAPPTSADIATIPPLQSTEPVILTPPSWFPLHVSQMDEPDEIADYVHHLIGMDIEWAEYHVKRTTMADIQAMQYRTMVMATADLSGTPNPAEAVWIVGFRSVEPFPIGRLESAMGVGYGHGERPGGVADHYVAYVLVSINGDVVGVGTVDDVTADGTPVPRGEWSIADIQSLREVP